MDKKKKTILLLVIAAVVWGYTGVKWFNYIATDDTAFVQANNSIVTPSTFNINEKKDYKLLADYTDPFLKKSKKHLPKNNNIHSPVKVSKPIINNKPVEKVKVNWPTVVYTGLILNENQRVGFLNIENDDLLARKGDVYKQIEVLEIYNDSIFLSFQNERKTYYKKE